jgi:hypothetical protein
MILPKVGGYYCTGLSDSDLLYLKVLKVRRGTNGYVRFIDSFEPPGKEVQWSYLSDWIKDLKTGVIRPAPVLTAMKKLGELG